MALVKMHREHWPRNEVSRRALYKDAKNQNGVYVLRDGSMPLYIGTGRIGYRIQAHSRSKSKGNYWLSISAARCLIV